ncbi:MAG TPA: DUF4836 family protein [Chitinophagaceae bacterium]|nr:DUF4836 family protein [Chitinophagaceae bacterium]
MKYIKLISLIGLFSILIFSCGKKNNLGRMIPKEASIVIELNTKSILSKLSWDEIKKSYWYNKLMTDSSIPATSKAFIDDPAKTGIDVKSNMIFFILKPENNGQAIFEGSLKDSKAFAEFIKVMQPNAVLSKDGELNIYKTDSSIIGWNNEKFAILSNADSRKFMDSSALNDSTKRTMPFAPLSSDSLEITCKNIFKLTDDNSLYKNEKFAKLLDEDGDIHFWVNTNELSKGSMPGMPGMAGMVKLNKFLEDNVSTATINFEDGKITGHHKQYFGKELFDILKKGDGNINTDMIKKLPANNLAGLFSLHFTPGSLLEIIKLTGLDGFINLFLSAQGLSLDDIIKATKGDILFAVTDISMIKDTAKKIKELTIQDTLINYYNKTDATYLFAVAVGDKDAFNKMLGFANKMGKDSTPKNTFQKTDDKYFVISNKQDAVNKYFSGPQTNPEFLSLINNHPMGGFVDIQMILKAMQPEFTKDSISNAFYIKNIATWNNFSFTGGEYKNGGLVSNGELNFLDKKTNSLKQLSQYADDIAKIKEEERKKRRLNWTSDSIRLQRGAY